MKVAAISAISNELLKDSSPAAEQMVRDSLIASVSQKIDEVFLSDDALSAGVSPAGLRRNLAALHSAGNDADAVLADIKALYAPFITAKNASGLVFVMNTALAKSLSLMRNTLGVKVFPGITATGGTLEGDTVVTGDNVNAAHVYLLKPSDIYKIGDTGLEISVSNQATVEMSTAPTGAGLGHTAASANLQNMFQQEQTAIKIVRPFNFQKRRSTAVAWIDDADYGSPST